jgi:DNA-binding MarR family transcriptional regulator
MNAYVTQPVRRRSRICWQEEYILGMVQVEGPIGTTGVLKIALERGIMSQATSHKYLKKLVTKKLLIEKPDVRDRRGWVLSVSAKGEGVLEEIKDAYRK